MSTKTVSLGCHQSSRGCRKPASHRRPIFRRNDRCFYVNASPQLVFLLHALRFSVISRVLSMFISCSHINCSAVLGSRAFRSHTISRDRRSLYSTLFTDLSFVRLPSFGRNASFNSVTGLGFAFCLKAFLSLPWLVGRQTIHNHGSEYCDYRPSADALLCLAATGNLSHLLGERIAPINMLAAVA